MVCADIFTEGRLMLGVGRGAFGFEMERLGVPIDTSREKFDESLNVLTALLRDEEVSWDGTYYKFDALTVMPRPVRAGGPPIMMAVMVPEAIYHCTKRGFHIQTTPLSGDHRHMLDQVDAFNRGKAELEEAGRDLTLSLSRVAFVARNEADRRSKVEAANGYYSRFDNVYTGPGIVEHGMIAPLPRKQTVEELAESLLICTPRRWSTSSALTPRPASTGLFSTRISAPARPRLSTASSVLPKRSCRILPVPQNPRRLRNEQGSSIIVSQVIDCDYTVEGSGPPLFLIHGIGAARDTWRFVTPGLTDHFTVVSYDLRGHGTSPMPDGEFGLDDLVNDLERVRERTGFEQAHFAGHSLGGMIGPAYARKHPGRVLSLGLLSTAAGRTEDDSAKVWGVVRAMEEKGVAQVLDTLIDRWYTDAFIAAHPDLVDRRLKQVVGTDSQSLHERVPDLCRHGNDALAARGDGAVAGAHRRVRRRLQPPAQPTDRRCHAQFGAGHPARLQALHPARGRRRGGGAPGPLRGRALKSCRRATAPTRPVSIRAARMCPRKSGAARAARQAAR